MEDRGATLSDLRLRRRYQALRSIIGSYELPVITAAPSRRVRARSVLFGRWVGLDERDI